MSELDTELERLFGVQLDDTTAQQAVMVFQMRNNLPATGEPDNVTMVALRANPPARQMSDGPDSPPRMMPGLAAVADDLPDKHVLCLGVGHRFDQHQRFDYKDGSITLWCVTCGDRIQLEWFPGGTYVPRALYELEQIMRDESSVDFGKDAATIDKIERLLKDDAKRIQDVLYSVELTKQILAKRMRDVGSDIRGTTVARKR